MAAWLEAIAAGVVLLGIGWCLSGGCERMNERPVLKCGKICES